MPSDRKQLNLRPVPEIWDTLDRLKTETGLSYAALVYQGIRLLARRELPSSPKKTSEKIQNSS